MKEKDIIPQYMADLSRTNLAQWWYKIPDNRFTGKKPFDVIGAITDDKGVAYPIAYEFKLHKTLSPWPCKKVIDFQEESLLAFEKVGGLANVVLGVRLMLKPDEQKKFNYPTRRVNLWVTWPVREFREYRASQTHVDIRALLLKGETGHVNNRSL